MSAIDELAAEIDADDKVLVLGGVDVGKTTLIRELETRVDGEVIDADVGQSTIGPPTLISRGSYATGQMEDGYFVGDVSPRGNFLQVLTGIERMVSAARRPCLIDSDGYIDGDAARAYKSEMINLIEPDKLILLQRADELAYYPFRGSMKSGCSCSRR
ncbi:MAG: Clp1/GlmU family protein [Candidatus Bipolaricaulia bacterium]